MKLTEWFPADVKPVRPGYYSVKYTSPTIGDFPAWFDGTYWRLFPESTKRFKNQSREWRGLAEKP